MVSMLRRARLQHMGAAAMAEPSGRLSPIRPGPRIAARHVGMHILVVDAGVTFSQEMTRRKRWWSTRTQ